MSNLWITQGGVGNDSASINNGNIILSNLSPSIRFAKRGISKKAAAFDYTGDPTNGGDGFTFGDDVKVFGNHRLQGALVFNNFPATPVSSNQLCWLYASNLDLWMTTTNGSERLSGNSGAFVLKSGDTMTGPLTLQATPLIVEYPLADPTARFVVTNFFGSMWFTEQGLSLFKTTSPFIYFKETLTGLNGSIIFSGADNSFISIDNGIAVIKSGFPDVYGGINSNAVHYGDGSLLTNVPTVGLTTNFTVFLTSGATNSLFFTNGLLVAMISGTPPSGLFLLDDTGQYILTDTGNYILLNP
jgi:hypothetical protein